MELSALRGPYFVAAALLFGAAATQVTGCDTGAVGEDACRAIESARCDAAPACQSDPDDFGISPDTDAETWVRNCKAFYNDHCLNGIENNSDDDNDPDQETIEACVAAVNATAECQRSNVATMAECTDVAMVEGSEALTPCQALHKPEKISACKFVMRPPKDD